ncbi:uncharacterized protein EDB91DRAFT_138725 [Suillus paluster]|uniref:uncharacterized protein n=1 Tax=Suillus paluster TaxID=48578 RepID=UPI001B863AFC|nr:uncharacterized protein EDB91DRAFT_138725 [Suillus paluster]KAG1746019.1 hypothetical protein EDB91DRAFT_138725 [Suillus paluster]
MKPKAEFQFLAEELQCYILSFLPYQDILRCTSVCKTLHQTYILSSELQYIVELGGQRLLHVPNTNLDNHASVFQRLQLLRDKAHAWFGFDVHSFKTVSIPAHNKMWVANGHLCLWERGGDSTTIFPILPKPSQYTIEHDRSPTSLRSDPNAYSFDVFMDPVQNLIAIVCATVDDHFQWDDKRIYIDLGALDGGGIHPLAAGRTLFLSELPEIENSNTSSNRGSFKLKGFGRHIALWRSLRVVDQILPRSLWGLQIWDWQHSPTSSSVLSDTIYPAYEEPNDFCFLGNDRLLMFSDTMKLYSIEDMSQAPQLLVCFLLPVSMTSIQCIQPMDDTAHSSRPPMQFEQTMWTSDPKQQLLCVVTRSPSLVFIISTRIFFGPDFFEETPTAISWKHWGPLNARVFRCLCGVGVGIVGNRVLLPYPTDDRTDIWHVMKYRLHVMDFSPLAVERRQCLGRVVKEPSTIEITQPWSGESLAENLTTSLPYVEVVLDQDKKFGFRAFERIWIDKDRIYFYHGSSELEVVDIAPRVTEAAKPTTSSDD